jgi:hypothetical protein
MDVMSSKGEKRIQWEGRREGKDTDGSGVMKCECVHCAL